MQKDHFFIFQTIATRWLLLMKATLADISDVCSGSRLLARITICFIPLLVVSGSSWFQLGLGAVLFK